MNLKKIEEADFTERREATVITFEFYSPSMMDSHLPWNFITLLLDLIKYMITDTMYREAVKVKHTGFRVSSMTLTNLLDLSSIIIIYSFLNTVITSLPFWGKVAWSI